METLSVVIPAWSGNDALVDMTWDLARGVKPMCDELIISEDGFYSQKLEEIADIYLLHPRLGHGVNLNLGFRVSTGEYVALLDSDIIIMKGTLRDLVIPERVVCPVHPNFAPLQGWFVVAPRWVITQCPPYDRTDAHGEGIDFWAEELWNLSKDILVNSDKVEYHHRNSRSYSEHRKMGDGRPVSDGRLKGRLERLRELQSARMMEDAAMAQIMGSRMPREIDPHRHKQRLGEDVQYRRVWLHTL